MQFDHDIQSPHADLFLYLRDIFLGFEAIHEIKNAKQTSYKDTHGRAIVLMRVRTDGARVIFAQGAKLQPRYPFLLGEGKIVRHLMLRSIEEVDEALMREIIEESLVLSMEHREMQRMRRQLTHST
jgi:hypothetical protein